MSWNEFAVVEGQVDACLNTIPSKRNTSSITTDRNTVRPQIFPATFPTEMISCYSRNLDRTIQTLFYLVLKFQFLGTISDTVLVVLLARSNVATGAGRLLADTATPLPHST
jgi:hypothetical protein